MWFMKVDMSVDVHLVQIPINADKLQAAVDFRLNAENFLAKRLVLAVFEEI